MFTILRKTVKVVQCGCILAFFCSSGFSQDTGAINGQVIDPTNAAVPSATVEAVNQDTHLSRQALSNPEGIFYIPALPPGTYTLTAHVSGFKSFARTGVVVAVNQNTRADVQLQVGAVAENVTVQATVLNVDTHSDTVGHTMDTQELQSLPVLDRDMLNLATLLPGVGPASFPTTVTGSRSGPTVSVNGNRPRDNSFLLDGASFVASLYNTPQNLPTPDAVEEFRVMTNTYSAEFGQGAGSIFLAVTKSGTDTFHGSLYEYLRNSDANARNLFASAVPLLKQNQFGGTFGGPVRLPHYNGKDRTFFFVSYEGLRLRSQTIDNSFPPTALERAGNFSASTKPIIDPTTNQPFPGNIIPTTRLDPLAVGMNSAYMLISPNQPNGSSTNLHTFATTDNQMTLRADQRVSAANTLSVRYYRNNDGIRETTPVTLYPLVVAGSNLPIQSVTLSDTHSFGPTVVNEFRMTYTRIPSNQLPSAVPQKTARELGGNFNQQDQVPLAPGASISGRTSFSPGSPQRVDVDNVYQIEDKVSWMRGRHSLKFGFSDIYDRQLTQSNFRTNGGFTFDGSFTGNSEADFMLGQSTSLLISDPYYTNLVGSDYAAYAQDTITVSRRLTLDFGVRYQLHVPWSNWRGYTATVIPGDQSTYEPTAPPGLMYYGDPGIPKGLYKENKKDFEPRIGIAWDVFGTGRTAVRAGFGLYTRGQAGIMVQHGYEMPPFERVISLSGDISFSNPWNGGPDPFPYQMNIKNPAYQYPLQAFNVDPNFEDAYTQQYNVNVQQQIGSDIFVQVAYVGKEEHHLSQAVETNAALFGPGATVANEQQRRPFYPQYYAGITSLFSVGNGNYNAFQTSIRKRFSRGYMLNLGYTWSKAIDDGSNDNGENSQVSDPYNYLKGERGLAAFDRRNIVSVTGVWDVPVLRGNSLLARLSGGWELSGSMYFSSGAPFSIATGQDNAELGGSRGLGSQRAMQVASNAFLDPSRTRSQLIAKYFNTAAFAAPAAGTFGDSGRDVMTGPGNFTTNMALIKNFRLGRERLGKFQFRAEGYNLINWVNLSNPVATMTAPNFGAIASAGAARVMQFALRYDF
jgi:Carboxypeptidase regulatory-like domain